ncbi:hypothetical protein BH11MYX1_BH11MYX1_32480 [soil metagenome]
MLGAIALIACTGAPAVKQPDPPDPHAGHQMAMPPTAGGTGELGAELPITCGAKAQTEFDTAFALLHNMDYVDARTSFTKVRDAEPRCAIAYWGLAMTYFQPLWPGKPTDEAMKAGAAAVAAAREATLGDTVSADYVAAVASFYNDWEHVGYAARLTNWLHGQEVLATKYPEDVEAQAFLALAQLATIDKSDKDRAYKAMLAIGLGLEKLLVKRPRHPGLMHYLLHAYDNPLLAERGIATAQQYATSSPDAAHALHMPSHIFVRLGDWKRVIESNLASRAAALKHPAGIQISRDFLHATDYLVYGYLQLGDDANAKTALDQLDAKADYERSSGPAAYSLAAGPARFTIEHHAWKDAAALVVRAVPYDWEHYPWAEAVTHAARGLGAARLGDAKGAMAELALLDELVPKIDAAWWQGRVKIERDVISAWLAHARKDDKTAEQLLRDAAQRETAAGKDNVEPGHVIYAGEELGDLLVELGKTDAAIAAYDAVLADSPHRFNALYGRGRAAERAGHAGDARTSYQALIKGTIGARPERAHAQAYVTGP